MCKWLCLAVALFGVALRAQSPGIVLVGTAPSGACPQGAIGQLVNSSGHIWTCQSITGGVGTWTDATGGGGGGTVTAVTGVAPVASSGGTTPAISMHVADGSDNGYLASADWSTFNGKQPALSLLPGTYANTDLCTYTASGTVLNCNTATSTFQSSLGLAEGTYTNGDWCSYTASGTLLNCNNAAPQAALSLVKGTYSDGDTCTYTASGTVLNCNTAPSAGNFVNIGSAVTWTGCSFSGGKCSVSGSSTTTVTVSVIPGTYLGLVIKVGNMSQTGSGSTPDIQMTFNSDTTSGHYDRAYNYASGGANTQNGTAFIAIATAPTSGTYSAGFTVTLEDYATSTSSYRTVHGEGSTQYASNTNVYMNGGSWHSTAAITSITFTIGSNDFAAGTWFSIYGLN